MPDQSSLCRFSVPLSRTGQHGGARRPQRRNRGGHRDPPDQIPQQHRRTGSSSHQTAGTTDAGVQILQVSRGDAGRNRAHAHDPEGPVADDRRGVSGTAILFASGIKPIICKDAGCPTRKFATEPNLVQTYLLWPRRGQGRWPPVDPPRPRLSRRRSRLTKRVVMRRWLAQ